MTDTVLTVEHAQEIEEQYAASGMPLTWLVRREVDGYSARPLVTDIRLAYLLIRPTLDELRAALPRGLQRCEREPGDPPWLVEAWSSAAQQLR